MKSKQKVFPGPLNAFATAVYTAVGMPEADAKLAADTLVQADLWGHQSHGVLRLSWYAARLKAGVCNPIAHPEIVVDAGAIAVIDGKHAMGQVLTAVAANEAIRRAKVHGIGAVGLRNSNHFGTAMYFTLMGPTEGCVAAIAVMMDMLSGVLTGSAFGTGVHGPYQTAHRSGAGQLMIAINIESIQPLAEFNGRMEQLVAELKSVPLAQGFQEVLYPGEMEARNDTKNRANGLVLPDDTLADLQKLAEAHDLKSVLPF